MSRPSPWPGVYLTASVLNGGEKFLVAYLLHSLVVEHQVCDAYHVEGLHDLRAIADAVGGHDAPDQHADGGFDLSCCGSDGVDVLHWSGLSGSVVAAPCRSLYL